MAVGRTNFRVRKHFARRSGLFVHPQSAAAKFAHGSERGVGCRSKGQMLLLMATRNPVNSPVEGKVVYPFIYHYF